MPFYVLSKMVCSCFQTNVGNVLLSVNPYKKLLIYSPEVIDVYRCHCLHQLPPHMCVRERE